MKVPSPENRLMLLQLGMNETARSHAENYPLILKYLSAPVAVEKELVDPMFYVTALDDPCILIVIGGHRWHGTCGCCASVQESCGG